MISNIVFIALFYFDTTSIVINKKSLFDKHSLALNKQFVYALRMNDEIKQIELHGSTQVAKRMSERTGSKFYPQLIQHWKNRGVPYKWKDAFCAEFGITKQPNHNS